jgi:argininosuccinate lyase
MSKSNKLWQTGSGLNTIVEAYTVGDDYLQDQKLINYDIAASIVHAQMLNKVGVLRDDELEQLQQSFAKLQDLVKSGKFIVRAEQEDCHTAIEMFLTDELGELGKKIHTGRSRNDQSLVMIRLYMKDQLKNITEYLENLIANLNEASKKYQHVDMPGYTHMQKAMPTTVGIWLGSYADAWSDCLITIQSAKKQIDQNPLGSASGFGINNFTNDRDFTTQKLGFSKTQQNPIYCASSRGYFEYIFLNTICQPMLVAARFANDMMLFTTSEFNFFKLHVQYTTGSSIMPQKQNYDLFEIMRGNSKLVLGYSHQVGDIVAGLGAGYHRDLALTKKNLIQGADLCRSTLELLVAVVPELIVNEDVLKQAMTEDLFVTNKVYDLVNSGMSFREAYQTVKNNL